MAQPKIFVRNGSSGEEVNVYEKRTITQVRKRIRETGKFEGFVVPNKVSPSHFFDGWSMAYEVIFHSVKKLDECVQDMLFYMHPELGNHVTFYEEVIRREVPSDVE